LKLTLGVAFRQDSLLLLTLGVAPRRDFLVDGDADEETGGWLAIEGFVVVEQVPQDLYC
jgi:hypothetical protein